MKRKLLFLASAVICAAIAATGTLAYFSADYRQTNVITTGNVDIVLQEWADEDETVPFENLDGVMPGAEVTKIPEVVNTGASDAWIRVKLEKKIQIGGKEEVAPETADELIGLNIDSENWIDGGDGYYYYSSALKAGETTEPVFTKVSISKDMGNEYKNASITVDVAAEAVQVANNGESAQSAAGWPTAGNAAEDASDNG